uniref:Uncharacterized protein n=1 Tax=Mycena chlorophos TaxID=658473 RepID=A0ABQ0M122_MYCCL|nr:predicted protein [Mycena chlorophos]
MEMLSAWVTNSLRSEPEGAVGPGPQRICLTLGFRSHLLVSNLVFRRARTSSPALDFHSPLLYIAPLHRCRILSLRPPPNLLQHVVPPLRKLRNRIQRTVQPTIHRLSTSQPNLLNPCPSFHLLHVASASPSIPAPAP